MRISCTSLLHRNESRSPCLVAGAAVATHLTGEIELRRLAAAADPFITETVAQMQTDPCVQCGASLVLENRSCLAKYCKQCFDVNVQRNKELVANIDKAQNRQAENPLPAAAGSMGCNSSERDVGHDATAPCTEGFPTESPPVPPPEEAPMPEGACELSSELGRDTSVVQGLLSKPPGHSWCTFYQKVATSIGVDFDSKIISGRAALSKWKSMSPAEQQAWRSQHAAWSQQQQNKSEAMVHTPEKKQELLSSPVSEEKLARPPEEPSRMPDLKLLEEPQFEHRVASLAAFHLRWKPWQKKLENATPSFFLQNAQMLHMLYLDAVHLVQVGELKTFQMAEQVLKQYRVNRLKLSKYQTWLDEENQKETPNVNWAPQRFSAGRHGSGILSIPQRKDLLRHVLLMAQSNKALLPTEIKESMYKMVLLNRGMMSMEEAKHSDVPWDLYRDLAGTMEWIYKDWKKWVRETAPAEWQLYNKRIQTKTAEEASDISPATISQHFDLLQELLIECKLMCSDSGRLLPHAGQAIWTCDEKGLAGSAGQLKNAKALSTRAVPASKEAKEKSFGHITLLPFVNLSGECCQPFVFVKGSAAMHAWQQVWSSATVIATEQGSVTARWFTQILGLFGKHLRTELNVKGPAVLLLGSGGGGQLHITPEASCVADHFGLRLFFFRKNMTPAVCSLDQRPNQEAEKRWHQLIAEGTHEMSSLGAFHMARVVS